MISKLGASTVAFQSTKQIEDYRREYIEFLSRQDGEGRRFFVTRHDFDERFQIFIESAKYIEKHSAKSSYRLELNMFSDMREEEKEQMFGEGLQMQATTDPTVDDLFVPPSEQGEVPVLSDETPLPDSVDWVKAGKTTPIKDQGSCGSCWAFAAVSSVESAHAIRDNDLVALSEQQLVECDRDRNKGCQGGLASYAYLYLVDHKAYTEADWPYTALDDQVCTYAEHTPTDIQLASYVSVVTQSPQEMKKAVAKGPIAVSINASCKDFYFYKSGVIDLNEECSQTGLNHAVNIVGYGMDPEQENMEYWLVRNSWGMKWGDEGYCKIAIYDGLGLLGINTRPVYPILA